MDFLDFRLRVSDLVGSRAISDILPDLTRQAETVLSRRLRTMWQMQEFTPVWVGDEAPLPADFLALAWVENNLRVRGSTLIRKRPYHSYADLEYYAKLPTITTGPDGTNWLLDQFPNAYVYAAGVEAAKHLRMAEEGVAIQALLDGELDAIKIEDDRARYSHRVVRVAGCTP